MTESGRVADAGDAAELYNYVTELGTFRIVARRDVGVALWLDDSWLGTYPSAGEAATDVWDGSTGHRGWDRSHKRRDAPRTLRDWTAVADEIG